MTWRSFIVSPGAMNVADPLSRLAAHLAELKAGRAEGRVCMVQRDTQPLKRSRVTGTIYSPTRVLVHRDGAGSLTLPSTGKTGKQEPLRRAAARAIAELTVDEEAAQQLVMRRGCHSIGDSETRHVLCPVTEQELDGLVQKPR